MTQDAKPQITAQPGVMSITPYVGGKGPARGMANSVKLSSNENPHGPSPAASAAFAAIAKDLHVYPSSDHHTLRLALEEVHGVDGDHVICGNGSDEVISMLCQAFVGPGDEVLFTQHAFSMYRIRALASGGTPVEVPEQNRRADVDALLARITDKTRLVFLANPNNPTGTMIPHAEVERLADGIPGTALLVLDGAYAEFVSGHDGYAHLVEARDNVVMTRTFSKVYGLGGLRVGWGYASPRVIEILHRVRDPFNLNAGAIAAAEAAVRDTDYVAQCVAENAKWRDWLAAELALAGIPSDPSMGNFILARFVNEAAANAADAALAEAGLIVRQVAGYGLADCLRISIGTGSDCKRVAHVLRAFMETRP